MSDSAKSISEIGSVHACCFTFQTLAARHVVLLLGTIIPILLSRTPATSTVLDIQSCAMLRYMADLVLAM